MDELRVLPDPLGIVLLVASIGIIASARAIMCRGVRSGSGTGIGVSDVIPMPVYSARQALAELRPSCDPASVRRR